MKAWNIVIGLFLLLGILQTQAQTTIPQPEMVFVEGGSFKMGVTEGLKKEKPQHTVTLNSYYIGKYEVTQDLWVAVMGSNPSTFNTCGNCPVEEVTRESAEQFLNKLNELTGKKYRLPTEAEWEYAAIGGKLTKGYTFPGSNNLDEVAWNVNNANEQTHPVGLKKPNELGLYDMAGNAWELCADWYSPKYYKVSPSDSPLNTKKAIFRVARGGSWRSAANRCYNQARNRDVPDHQKDNLGIRLVLDK